MKKWISRILALTLALMLSLTACGPAQPAASSGQQEIGQEQAVQPESSPEEISEESGEQKDSAQAASETAQEPEKEAALEEEGDLEEETLEEKASEEAASAKDAEELLPEDGTYTSKEDVALYIHQYGCLPSNFITKKEAEKLGWSGGSLEPYAPGMCIGGSRFGNYEGLLPEKKGRTYTECDIDTLGASKRGAKRIVFSNDGLIYYTEDHYESFELLYGEET